MENEKDTDKIVSLLKKFFESKEFPSVLNLLPQRALSIFFENLANATIENSFQAYMCAVDEVRRDKRKTPKARKEKLKKLLTPVMILNKAIALDKAHTLGTSVKENSARLTLPDGTSLFPFIPLTVDLNSDLDVSKLVYNKDSYRIPYVQCQKNGACVVHDEALLGNRLGVKEIWHKEVSATKEELEVIPVSKKTVKVKVTQTVLEEGGHDLWDLYEWWLPSLDSKRLKSIDLLDQILVVYTIKRALNGDSKAIDALFRAYERAAIGIACKMVKKRKLGQYLEDIKQDAWSFLRLTICGFTPESIFNSLMETEKILPFPKWIESFYIWYYSEYVPEAMTNHLEKIERQEQMHPIYEAFFILALLCFYTPIRDKNRWVAKNRTRINRFNSYSYRPNKNTNLTVWLFGTLTNPMQGRFCQLVSQQLDAYYKAHGIETYENNLPDSSRYDDEESEESQRRYIIEKLIENGVSERNAEIFSKNTFDGYSKVDLAKEYNLTRMTIHRICKHIIKTIKENKFL